MFASPENIARKARLLPLMAMIVVAACSSVPETERTDQRDPYEASNRKAFAFNMAVDTHLLEPAASSYRKLMPMAGRRAIDNHVDWTGLPATTFNSTLQGRFENAGLSAIHFTINSLTLGLIDLTENPKAVKEQDFGQTLASFDVPEGNYLMVPLLGPNTSRSLTGRIVDGVTNPMSFLKAGSSIGTMQSLRTPVAVVAQRANLFEPLNDVKYNSLDPYARTRSLYYQGRAGRINAKIGKPTDNRTTDDQFESFLERALLARRHRSGTHHLYPDHARCDGWYSGA
ncbi:MAG: VacJ family lipoprotein [Alphaproteobacteria bacterium]|nr:VacJ family lipoprotein [Alphaproteobacteria bacterium]